MKAAILAITFASIGFVAGAYSGNMAAQAAVQSANDEVARLRELNTALEQDLDAASRRLQGVVRAWTENALEDEAAKAAREKFIH